MPLTRGILFIYGDYMTQSDNEQLHQEQQTTVTGQTASQTQANVTNANPEDVQVPKVQDVTIDNPLVVQNEPDASNEPMSQDEVMGDINRSMVTAQFGYTANTAPTSLTTSYNEAATVVSNRINRSKEEIEAEYLKRISGKKTKERREEKNYYSESFKNMDQSFAPLEDVGEYLEKGRIYGEVTGRGGQFQEQRLYDNGRIDLNSIKETEAETLQEAFRTRNEDLYNRLAGSDDKEENGWNERSKNAQEFSKLAKDVSRYARDASSSERSTLRAVTDTLTSVVSSGIGMAADMIELQEMTYLRPIGYAANSIFGIKTEDNPLTSMSAAQVLGSIVEFLDSTKSVKLRTEQKMTSTLSKAQSYGVKLAAEVWKEKYGATWGAMMETAANIKNSVWNSLTNGYVLADGIATMLPYMAGLGAISGKIAMRMALNSKGAKNAIAKLIAGGTDAAAARAAYLARPEVAKRIQRLTALNMTVLSSASDARSAKEEVYHTITSMSHGDLMQSSEQYKTLVSAGYTEEQAKKAVALGASHKASYMAFPGALVANAAGSLSMTRLFGKGNLANSMNPFKAPGQNAARLADVGISTVSGGLEGAAIGAGIYAGLMDDVKDASMNDIMQEQIVGGVLSTMYGTAGHAGMNAAGLAVHGAIPVATTVAKGAVVGAVGAFAGGKTIAGKLGFNSDKYDSKSEKRAADLEASVDSTVFDGKKPKDKEFMQDSDIVETHEAAEEILGPEPTEEDAVEQGKPLEVLKKEYTDDKNRLEKQLKHKEDSYDKSLIGSKEYKEADGTADINQHEYIDEINDYAENITDSKGNQLVSINADTGVVTGSKHVSSEVSDILFKTDSKGKQVLKSSAEMYTKENIAKYKEAVAKIAAGNNKMSQKELSSLLLLIPSFSRENMNAAVEQNLASFSGSAADIKKSNTLSRIRKMIKDTDVYSTIAEAADRIQKAKSSEMAKAQQEAVVKVSADIAHLNDLLTKNENNTITPKEAAELAKISAEVKAFQGDKFNIDDLVNQYAEMKGIESAKGLQAKQEKLDDVDTEISFSLAIDNLNTATAVANAAVEKVAGVTEGSEPSEVPSGISAEDARARNLIRASEAFKGKEEPTDVEMSRYYKTLSDMISSVLMINGLPLILDNNTVENIKNSAMSEEAKQALYNAIDTLINLRDTITLKNVGTTHSEIIHGSELNNKKGLTTYVAIINSLFTKLASGANVLVNVAKQLEGLNGLRLTLSNKQEALLALRSKYKGGKLEGSYLTAAGKEVPVFWVGKSSEKFLAEVNQDLKAVHTTIKRSVKKLGAVKTKRKDLQKLIKEEHKRQQDHFSSVIPDYDKIATDSGYFNSLIQAIIGGSILSGISGFIGRTKAHTKDGLTTYSAPNKADLVSFVKDTLFVALGIKPSKVISSTKTKGTIAEGLYTYEYTDKPLDPNNPIYGESIYVPDGTINADALLTYTNLDGEVLNNIFISSNPQLEHLLGDTHVAFMVQPNNDKASTSNIKKVYVPKELTDTASKENVKQQKKGTETKPNKKHNPNELSINPNDEGITHINISSGESDLAKMLKPSFKGNPLSITHDGKELNFANIHQYLLWATDIVGKGEKIPQEGYDAGVRAFLEANPLVAQEIQALGKDVPIMAYLVEDGKPIADISQHTHAILEAYNSLTEAELESFNTNPTVEGETSEIKREQALSNKATDFIGVGSKNSLTNRFREAWNKIRPKNTNKLKGYTTDDVVYVSLDHKGRNRKSLFSETPNAEEKQARQALDAAVKAGAIFTIGDSIGVSKRSEKGKLIQLLKERGYVEYADGIWAIPSEDNPSVSKLKFKNRIFRGVSKATVNGIRHSLRALGKGRTFTSKHMNKFLRVNKEVLEQHSVGALTSDQFAQEFYRFLDDDTTRINLFNLTGKWDKVPEGFSQEAFDKLGAQRKAFVKAMIDRANRAATSHPVASEYSLEVAKEMMDDTVFGSFYLWLSKYKKENLNTLSNSEIFSYIPEFFESNATKLDLIAALKLPKHKDKLDVDMDQIMRTPYKTVENAFNQVLGSVRQADALQTSTLENILNYIDDPASYTPNEPTFSRFTPMGEFEPSQRRLAYSSDFLKQQDEDMLNQKKEQTEELVRRGIGPKSPVMTDIFDTLSNTTVPYHTAKKDGNTVQYGMLFNKEADVPYIGNNGKQYHRKENRWYIGKQDASGKYTNMHFATGDRKIAIAALLSNDEAFSAMVENLQQAQANSFFGSHIKNNILEYNQDIDDILQDSDDARLVRELQQLNTSIMLGSVKGINVVEGTVLSEAGAQYLHALNDWAKAKTESTDDFVTGLEKATIDRSKTEEESAPHIVETIEEAKELFKGISEEVLQKLVDTKKLSSDTVLVFSSNENTQNIEPIQDANGLSKNIRLISDSSFFDYINNKDSLDNTLNFMPVVVSGQFSRAINAKVPYITLYRDTDSQELVAKYNKGNPNKNQKKKPVRRQSVSSLLKEIFNKPVFDRKVEKFDVGLNKDGKTTHPVSKIKKEEGVHVFEQLGQDELDSKIFSVLSANITKWSVMADSQTQTKTFLDILETLGKEGIPEDLLFPTTNAVYQMLDSSSPFSRISRILTEQFGSALMNNKQRGVDNQVVSTREGSSILSYFTVDGMIPPEIISAIALATVSTFSTVAGGIGGRLSEADIIKRYELKDKNVDISALHKAFGEGIPRGDVFKNITASFYKLLGVSPKLSDVTNDMATVISQSIGAEVVAALMNTGYLETHKVDKTEYTPDVEMLRVAEKVSVMDIAVESTNPAFKLLDELKESASRRSYFVGAKAPKFDKNKSKGVNALQQAKYKTDTQLINIARALGFFEIDNLTDISLGVIANSMPSLKDSLISQRNGIEKEIDTMEDIIQQLINHKTGNISIDKGVFFMQEASDSVQRITSGNASSPQGMKLLRSLLHFGAKKVEIRGPNGILNRETIKTSILLALGVKTENVLDLGEAGAEGKYNELMASESWKNAIEVFQTKEQKDFTQEDYDKISLAIQEHGGKLSKLEKVSLIDVIRTNAAFEKAMAHRDKYFYSSMMVYVDGVSHGPSSFATKLGSIEANEDGNTLALSKATRIFTGTPEARTGASDLYNQANDAKSWAEAMDKFGGKTGVSRTAYKIISAMGNNSLISYDKKTGAIVGTRGAGKKTSTVNGSYGGGASAFTNFIAAEYQSNVRTNSNCVYMNLSNKTQDVNTDALFTALYDVQGSKLMELANIVSALDGAINSTNDDAVAMISAINDVLDNACDSLTSASDTKDFSVFQDKVINDILKILKLNKNFFVNHAGKNASYYKQKVYDEAVSALMDVGYKYLDVFKTANDVIDDPTDTNRDDLANYIDSFNNRDSKAYGDFYAGLLELIGDGNASRIWQAPLNNLLGSQRKEGKALVRLSSLMAMSIQKTLEDSLSPEDLKSLTRREFTKKLNQIVKEKGYYIPMEVTEAELFPETLDADGNVIEGVINKQRYIATYEQNDVQTRNVLNQDITSAIGTFVNAVGSQYSKINTASLMYGVQDLGVGFLARYTISKEAQTIQQTAEDLFKESINISNVHDSIGTNIADAVHMTRTVNKNLLNTLRSTESLVQLHKMTSGIQNDINNIKLLDGLINDVKKFPFLIGETFKAEFDKITDSYVVKTSAFNIPKDIVERYGKFLVAVNGRPMTPEEKEQLGKAVESIKKLYSLAGTTRATSHLAGRNIPENMMKDKKTLNKFLLNYKLPKNINEHRAVHPTKAVAHLTDTIDGIATDVDFAMGQLKGMLRKNVHYALNLTYTQAGKQTTEEADTVYCGNFAGIGDAGTYVENLKVPSESVETLVNKLLGKTYEITSNELPPPVTVEDKRDEFISFAEDMSSGYRARTLKNASADATIALATNFNSAGEKLTKKSVKEQGKKYIPIDASSLEVTEDRVNRVVQMLNSVGAKTLNIAGNGIYTMRGAHTQQAVDRFTYELLSKVVNSPDLIHKIESIRTGGQTGFDEAGAKAGLQLGIPTSILAPKGWKFRDASGRDISDESLFKARFNTISLAKTQTDTLTKAIQDLTDSDTSDVSYILHSDEFNKALEKTSFGYLAQGGAKNSSALIQAITKSIQGTGTKIKFVKEAFTSNGNATYGSYNGSTGTVTIALTTNIDGNVRNVPMEKIIETLVHESIHAATQKAIFHSTDEGIRNDVTKLAKLARDIAKDAGKPVSEMKYGMPDLSNILNTYLKFFNDTNQDKGNRASIDKRLVNELMAFVLTEPLQANNIMLTKNISEVENSGVKGFLKSVVGFIKKVLGLINVKDADGNKIQVNENSLYALVFSSAEQFAGSQSDPVNSQTPETAYSFDSMQDRISYSTAKKNIVENKLAAQFVRNRDFNEKWLANFKKEADSYIQQDIQNNVMNAQDVNIIKSKLNNFANLMNNAEYYKNYSDSIYDPTTKGFLVDDWISNIEDTHPEHVKDLVNTSVLQMSGSEGFLFKSMYASADALLSVSPETRKQLMSSYMAARNAVTEEKIKNLGYGTAEAKEFVETLFSPSLITTDSSTVSNDTLAKYFSVSFSSIKAGNILNQLSTDKDDFLANNVTVTNKITSMLANMGNVNPKGENIGAKTEELFGSLAKEYGIYRARLVSNYNSSTPITPAGWVDKHVYMKNKQKLFKYFENSYFSSMKDSQGKLGSAKTLMYGLLTSFLAPSNTSFSDISDLTPEEKIKQRITPSATSLVRNLLVAGTKEGKPLGWFRELVAELWGQHEGNQDIMNQLSIAKATQDRARTLVVEQVPKMLEEKFGRKLLKTEKAVLKRTVLDTDLSSLWFKHKDGIKEIVSNADKTDGLLIDSLDSLAQAIGLQKGIELPKNVYKQLSGLGEYLNTQRNNTNFIQLPNAEMITRLIMHQYPKVKSSEFRAIKAIVDETVSLYAVKHMNKADKVELSSLLNSDYEGMEAFMAYTSSTLLNYPDSERNVLGALKGSTYNVTDPSKRIIVVPVHKIEEHLNQGATLLKKAKVLKADGSGHQDLMALMVTPIRQGGYSSGAARIIQEVLVNDLGSKISPKNEVPAYALTNYFNQIIKNEDASGNDNGNVVLTTNQDFSKCYAIPSIGRKNNDNTVNTYENGFESIARTSGRIQEAIGAEEHNKHLVKILYESYRKDALKFFDTDGSNKGFIKISADSEDPRVKEVYHLLPKEMIEYGKEIFGGDIIVAKDNFNQAFGNRQWTMSDVFSKDESELSKPERAIKYILTALLGKSAAPIAIKGADILSEWVGISKHSVVVLNLAVQSINAVGNMAQLAAEGVNIVQQAKDYKAGLQAAEEYRMLLNERTRLNAELEILMSSSNTQEVSEKTKATNDKLRLVQTRLDNSLVAPLMKAGLFSTISQDQTNGTRYSTLMQGYNKLVGAVDGDSDTENLNTVTKNILGFKGSTVGNFLHLSNQYSDFLPKFSLYMHLTTRSENPLSSEKALHYVRDAFVDYNYNVGMTRQTLEKFGGTWFTNYAMRIVKSTVRLAQNNPARLLALHHLTSTYGLTSNLDSKLLQGEFDRLFQPSRILNVPTVPGTSVLDIITSDDIVHKLTGARAGLNR